MDDFDGLVEIVKFMNIEEVLMAIELIEEFNRDVDKREMIVGGKYAKGEC